MDKKLGQGSSTVEDHHFLRLSRCELAALPRRLPLTEKHNFTITLTYGMDIYFQFLSMLEKAVRKAAQ
jgi:hypothetical protein